MRSRETWIVVLAAIVVGATVAFAASLPAFILGAQIASNWLPGQLPPGGELFMALPLLAVLASVLGLPGAFLGARSGSWRTWYAWVITPLVSATISGFPCVAVCLFSGTSLSDPVAFTIVFGVTIGGLFSGLASRGVAATRESLERQKSDERRKPNGGAAPCHVELAAKRAVRWPGWGLLVLGTLNVAYVALAALLPLITGPGPAAPGRPGLMVLVLWAVQFALGVVMIVGGSKMRDLRGYWYALAAAIAAIVPSSCFVFLTLPVGLWSLIILRDAGVRSTFRD